MKKWQKEVEETMLVNRKAVKLHAHSLGKQLNGEALPALNECVRMLIEDAAKLTRAHTRINPFEIYYAAGRSKLAIKPKGR